jgi:hypothetical protein
MNKRIKELAEQAEILMGEDSYGKFAVVPGHEKDPISRQGKAESFDALEKFAELIVRECAQVAFEGDLKRAIGQWGSHSDILKHFEVEHDVVKTFRS